MDMLFRQIQPYEKGTPLETKTLLDFPGHFFEQAIKALLCLILLALVGTIGAVVIQTFIDLGHCFAAVGQETELHHHFKQILVDVLTGLAIVEVYRTALAYFIEGRVKVTYLIDAVLVAVLTEIMAFWYREIDPVRVGMVILLVLTLMFVRIMAIRFSPRRREMSEGL
jgi:uncharacterized membrane protein (DUF373 family)